MTIMGNVITDHMQAEEELRKALQAAQASKAQYEQIVSMISDIVWRYDVNAKGEHVGSYISPVADRMLGLPDGTIGNSFDRYLSYVHPDDLPAVQELISEGIRTRGKDNAAEYRMRRADGTTLWVRSKGSAYSQPDGRVTVFGTTSDITDRKLADDEMRRSEGHLRLAAEGANLGTYTYDFISGQGYWSPKLKAFYGLRADEPLVLDEEGVALALHPEDRSAFLSAMIAANDPYGNVNGVLELDYRIIRTDGSIRWLRVHGRTEFIGKSNKLRPWRAAGVATDITEHKYAEEALKESRARHELAIQSAQMGSWVLDVAMNKRDFDAQTCHLLGIDHATFKGSPEEFFRVVHPDDRGAIRAALAKSIEQDAPYELAYRVTHPDGSVRHIVARGRVIRDRNRRPLKLIGIIWDDTESKQAEDELKWKTALLEAQVEATSDGILVVDSQGQRIITNQQLLNIWKVPQEIRNHKNDEALLQYVVSKTKNSDQFLEKVMYLYDHKDETSQDEIEFKDGIVLDRYSSPVIGRDGKYYGRIWIFHDITDHKLALEALRESEQRLSSIIDFLPDATFALDREGKVIAWNRAMEEMTGVNRNDMIGQGDHAYTVPFYGERRQHLLDLLDKEDNEIVSKYQYVQRKGDILYAEAFTPALYGGKGAYVWATAGPIFDVLGKRIGAIESIRDITDRKREQEELQNNLTFLETLIETIPSPIFLKDRQGRYIGCNDAFARQIVGLPKENIIGKSVFELSEAIPSDLADRYHEQDQELFREPGVQVYETQVECFDGVRRDFYFTKATFKDFSGDVAGIVGVMLDITKRKQAELSREQSLYTPGTIESASTVSTKSWQIGAETQEDHRRCGGYFRGRLLPHLDHQSRRSLREGMHTCGSD